MSEPNKLRPLYLVNELAQAVGQEVTYAYDDLVFISHSEVLVQFNDDESLNLYLHKDLDEALYGSTKAKYEITAKEQGTPLYYKGRFSMETKEGKEEINLEFFPE
ncbi:hypothetical protein [Coraliomargarita parva]|uniref:hypothetical protein n=1 Tax=Coraliomargarita parva TaxID=3014050 RepID=UPI0022B3F3A6|nr:hypothetical protein [Coraliomargarita parva]